jgi:hypothetical protein
MMATMNRNLSLVSPLCGPGFTAFWILTYISLLLTWTLHGTKGRQDHLGILFALAIGFPAAVSLHEAYLVYTYPGDRANLTSWTNRSLYAVNQAIFNDHIVTRTNLLLQYLILGPLCAVRMHIRRLNLLVAPLGPLLLGYYATENFLPYEGEELLHMWRDARGHTVWVRLLPMALFVYGLELTVLFLPWHLFFLVPRAMWRGYRRSGLGYLDDVPGDVPPGWRGYLYMFRNPMLYHRPWMDRWNLVICGVLNPCIVIWLFVPSIAADYRANLQSIRANYGLEDKLTALRLALLPRSQYSIWNWQQMVFLALGLAVLISAASEIWAERNSSGHIAVDPDLKNLESDTKREC